LSGQFVLFGQTLLIYEIYRFVFLALMLALILFLSAALYGRLWCGYACPQSIFIDRLFRLIEHVIRGSAVHRKRMANQPLSRVDSLRWLATQAVFLIVSAAFAWTLVALFAGTEATLAMNSNLIIVPFGVLTLLAWFDGAYWREQFCIIACPYARFQGVMQDQSTRSVGYDTPRGEPRGRGRRTDTAAKGDCID
jgi:polyferredoxin